MSISLIELTNKRGLKIHICDYGARIASIKYSTDNAADTHDSIELLTTHHDIYNQQYWLNDPQYLGATVGRVANRVRGGNFKIGDREYQLTTNDKRHCLHGGVNALSSRVWEINHQTRRSDFVELSIHSANGEQGFPGDVGLSVQYQLTEDNRLEIQYFADVSETTPINITSHPYFCLGASSLDELYLSIVADNVLTIDAENIPTGNLTSVEGSRFDFRSYVPFNTLATKHYDNTYVLAHPELTHPNYVTFPLFPAELS